MSEGQEFGQRELEGHSKIPLYFPEYQDVRDALARVEGCFQVLMPLVRERLAKDVRIEGIEETLSTVEAASVMLRAVYVRHLNEEAEAEVE
jgi:hypothetical protein